MEWYRKGSPQNYHTLYIIYQYSVSYVSGILSVLFFIIRTERKHAYAWCTTGGGNRVCYPLICIVCIKHHPTTHEGKITDYDPVMLWRKQKKNKACLQPPFISNEVTKVKYCMVRDNLSEDAVLLHVEEKNIICLFKIDVSTVFARSECSGMWEPRECSLSIHVGS